MGNLFLNRTAYLLLSLYCCLSGAMALTGGWVEMDPSWVTSEGEDSDGKLPGYVVDDNMGSSWKGSLSAAWRLTFDLQTPMTLSRIRIWKYGGPLDVTAWRWASSRRQWNVVTVQTAVEQELTGLLVTAQKWRLQFSALSVSTEINEIQFFQVMMVLMMIDDDFDFGDVVDFGDDVDFVDVLDVEDFGDDVDLGDDVDFGDGVDFEDFGDDVDFGHDVDLGDDANDACSGLDMQVCTDGNCDVYELLCDGVVDCDDGSDERNCTLAMETCANGDVINKSRVCDGQDDCGDNSDERNCCDRQGGKTCSNGNCVSLSKVCDGADNCGDGSDELSCPVGACMNGREFHLSTRCDGLDDCGDSSDELNCNCYHLQDKGASYRGLANRGETCQYWTSQYPHAHTHTPEAYPSAGLERNYCRNPDGKDGPWCYTNNPLIRWSYCDDVFACDAKPTRCFYRSDNGRSYAGRINRAGEKVCQRWDSQSPHIHLHTPQAHPDAGLEENFCRNPDNKERPWCYTTDVYRWSYCDVMECADPTYVSVNEERCWQPLRTSCKGLCGQRSLDVVKCNCDKNCRMFGDCCPDFDEMCSDTAQPDHQDEKWKCVPGFYKGTSYWLVADCPDDWTDDVTRQQCLKEVDSFNPSELAYRMPCISLTNLFNFGDDEESSLTHCPLNSVYDPFVDTCRLLKVDQTSQGSANGSAPLQNCSTGAVTFTAEEFEVLPNGSVHLLSANVTCPAEQVAFQNATALVCGECVLQYFSNDTRGGETTNPWEADQGYLTLGLVVVSVVAVVAFVFYSTRPDQWKKLSGKLKVQMILCMTAAESLFVGRVLVPTGPACTGYAILLHYLLLTAFSSMNALSLDLFLTFRQESERAALRSYMLYTWLMPVLFVVLTVFVEFCPCSSVRVGYGQQACWIGNPTGSLVVFGVPVMCALLANLVLIIHTLLAIRKSFKIADAALVRSDSSKAWVYLRISFLTGFTWIIGFIVPYVRSRPLEYIFIVLNASQGLLLTLLLTMTSDVMVKWMARIRERFWPGEARQDAGRQTTSTSARTKQSSASGTARGNARGTARGTRATAYGTNPAIEDIPMKELGRADKNNTKDSRMDVIEECD
ncbi:hypothetical protein Bbelb_164310 [Branchiostoma belcheri]|nr:hypothetical protein Bbelb_164310 [Branchiostoma belcheri]